MNMRVERNIIQQTLNEGIEEAGKAAKNGKVGSEPGLTVEHVAGSEHRGGLAPLGVDQMLPAPKPNALDALAPRSNADSDDVSTKSGSAAQNSAVGIMLAIGLCEIQSDQTMAKSQDDARRSALSNYVAQMDDAKSQIDDQAKDEQSQAWIEGVMGGIGATLSLAGAIAGPFAGAEDASFGAKLLGGTEMGAGILSTSGGLLGTTGDAIAKGTAGQKELQHKATETQDQAMAGIYQSAQGSAQEYRDKYWQMQQKALDAVQDAMKGLNQSVSNAASNV